jgi:hypothetical protein
VRTFWYAVFAACLAIPAFAQTQTNIWPADQGGLFREPAGEDKDKDKPEPMGWHQTAVLNANISLTSSEDVVGQTNGTSQTYGTDSKGGIYHLSEEHEWRNDLSLRESTTKTPSLGRFTKSGDELKLSTIYLFFVTKEPKTGPYARAEASSPIFKGEDVQSGVKTYQIVRKNGAADAPFSASSVRLTDGFKPLTTKEAVGYFYRPVWTPKLHLETRLGFAAQQIAADGQFAVKGANAAGQIEVDELRNVSQAGLEAGLSLKGKIDEKSSYEVGADTLTPFINNKAAGDRRDAWRLTNVDAFVKLTSKVTDWASFGYDYKLKIQPELVDRAQQIHMIVINLTYPVTPGKL